MPFKRLLTSQSVDLAASLGAEGEREYAQLVSMLQDAQGIFALMVVRSDFPVKVRNSFLERLAQDLSPTYCILLLLECIKSLTRHKKG